MFRVRSSKAICWDFCARNKRRWAETSVLFAQLEQRAVPGVALTALLTIENPITPTPSLPVSEVSVAGGLS